MANPMMVLKVLFDLVLQTRGGVCDLVVVVTGTVTSRLEGN